MKKLGLLTMPLVAVSLLASCGSKPIDPSKIDLYKKENIYDETGKNIDVIYEYEYNDKGLCTKYTETMTSTPNVKDVYECTYDEHKNENSLHLTSYDGEEIIDGGWTLNVYKYDEQNRITKQVTIMSFDYETWGVFQSYEYEYKDNVTIERNYDSDGSLDYTATYTYDEKGNLVNEKIIYSEGESIFTNKEKVYTVDKNGCATKIESYELSADEERGDLTEVSEITYLNNLWYRPLKEIVAYYVNGQIDSYTTYEREYDAKNRIKLYKIYDGTEEGETPSYDYYATYEY